MIIDKIEIFNHGPFYGKHEIKFDNDGEGVHIIRGNNGQGKTSIQRSILWGFYGEIKDRKGKEVPITSLVNRTSVKDFNLQTGVKIYFNHENKEWVLTRETHAKIHRKKDYEKNMSLYMVCEGKPEQNPQLLINRMIPAEVSKFFFFDGEMLRDYEELLEENSSSMKRLKNDIEHVLGIPYLNISREDLKEIKSNFEKDKSKLIRRLGGENYDEIAQQLENSVIEIERIEKLKKDLENQYDELELEISDKNRELIDYEETRKLAVEKIKLLKEVEILQNKEDNINKSNKKIISDLYKNILINISKDIIKQLEIKHEEKMGRYNEKQRLIQKLGDINKGLEESVCRLCKTVLNKDKLKYFKVEKKLTEDKIEELTEIPEPNLEYDASIKILERVIIIEDNRKELIENENEINKIYHELATKKARLNKIDELLKDVDEDEPFRIQKDIRNMQAELTRIEIDIKTAKERLSEELSKKI